MFININSLETKKKAGAKAKTFLKAKYGYQVSRSEALRYNSTTKKCVTFNKLMC